MPVGQSRQAVVEFAPAAGLNVPIWQRRQFCDVADATVKPYVPGGHLVHTAAAVTALYVPPWQGRHETDDTPLAPMTGLYFPSLQSAQETIDVEPLDGL